LTEMDMSAAICVVDICLASRWTARVHAE
jgi:hypothetical protein